MGQARCHSRKPQENALIVFAARRLTRLSPALIGFFAGRLNFSGSLLAERAFCFGRLPAAVWKGRGSRLPSASGAGLTHNEEHRLGRRSANAAVNKYNNH